MDPARAATTRWCGSKALGVGDSARRYLFADERGSIVAVTDANGTALAIDSYDEYGIPAAGNQGRFQYTGQAWVPELGMYYYKARMYSPTLGRFMQTDPIGYADGMNMYAYVGGDPINGVDPTGLFHEMTDAAETVQIVVIGKKLPPLTFGGGAGFFWGPGLGVAGPSFLGAGSGGGGAPGAAPQSDGPCPAVPSPGLGQRELDRRVNATAFRARVRNSDFFSIPSTDNRLELFLKSVPGARNDTKSYVRGSAEYGNFLFGAEAAAAGLSLQEALDWGANAQVIQDLAKFRLPTGSDNPGDAAAVARGHNYHRAGCSR